MQNASKKLVDKKLAEKHESEVWQKYMAASLDFAFTQTNWVEGKNKIATIEERVALAGDIADKALMHTKEKGKL